MAEEFIFLIINNNYYQYISASHFMIIVVVRFVASSRAISCPIQASQLPAIILSVSVQACGSTICVLTYTSY